MQITWLGHSGFRIQIEQAVLLIDPWLTGNPSFPAGREDEAVQGATHPVTMPTATCLGCGRLAKSGDQGALHPRDLGVDERQ